MVPGHGNQHKAFVRSILMHSAIEGVFRKPMKWYKLFQCLTSSAFNDLRVGDINEVTVQVGPRKQTDPHDGGHIFDACKVVDKLLIPNSH